MATTHWKLGSRQICALECSGIADGIMDEELEVIARHWIPAFPDYFRVPFPHEVEALTRALIEVSNHNDRIAEEATDRDTRQFCRQDSLAFSNLAQRVARVVNNT